jgi:TonB family protein
MRADGIVAALLAPDGRIDTATTRVLQVESMSVAGYRSAASRLLSTCRFRITGPKRDAPIPVVIALAFEGGPAQVSSAEQVPRLDAGIEAGPVLLPTQLPLAAEDGRIEESAMPDRGCTVWRDMQFTPRARMTAEEYQRDLSVQMAERRGRVRVGFEVDVNGRVVESSIDVTTLDNAKLAENFVKTIKDCRFAPARIGGVPVPVTMTMAVSTAGPR